MVKGATLALRALAVTEAQAGVGSGEQERKRKTANQVYTPQWQVSLLKKPYHVLLCAVQEKYNCELHM